MTTRRRALVAVATTAALGAAGCGGSGGGGQSGGQSSARAMTPQQFRAEVKQACSSTKANLQGIKGQLQGAGKDTNRLASGLRRFANEVQSLHDRLAKLQPPAQEAKGYQAYVSNLGQLHDQFLKFSDDVQRRDKQAVQRDTPQVRALSQRSTTLGQQVPSLRPCETG